jgi:hypothetical protein
MSAWSHLPNAAHIDRVIASLKGHQEIWVASWRASHDAVGDAAWCAAHYAARDEAYDAAWDAAYDAAQDAVCDMTPYAARSAAFDAAYDAILALFAYDDCDQYLNMPSEELQAWTLMTEHSAAVLLLPAVIAFERIKKLESV